MNICNELKIIVWMNICNELKIIDYGSIICDNCSDYDNRMWDKAQLSAAKIILGCFKTTSSNDVLADLNLTSLHLRREISLLCYVSKLILDMVSRPFPASFFRSFKEFVPYALRDNQNDQIPLLKKSLSYNFFRRLPACGILYHWKSHLQPATPSSWVV